MSSRLFCALVIAVSLASTIAARADEDRFRHLLNWSISEKPSLDESKKPNSGFRRPRTRGERQRLLQRWQWIVGLAESLHQAAGASPLETCSITDREALRDALRLARAHLESFRAKCLASESSPPLCNDEESRLDEAEGSLSDLANALSGCQERPHFGRMRVRATPRPYLSLGAGASIRKIYTEGPEDETRSFPWGHVDYFQGWNLDDDFAVSTHAKFVSGDLDARLAYEATSDASLDTGASLFRFHVFAKGTQDRRIESTDAEQLFQNFGASLAFALPRAIFSYQGSTFTSTGGAYSGYLNAVRAQGLLSSSAEAEQWVETRVQFFIASDRALLPSWQAVEAAYALQGLLEGGGHGELKLGIEERRSSGGFVRLMPHLSASFESATQWATPSTTYTGRMIFFFRPFTSFYSAVAQELGVSPSVEWSYKRLTVVTAAEFRREEHLSEPSGRRRNWTLGLELSPSYSLSSKMKLEGQFRFRHAVVQEAGREVDGVWSDPRLPYREVFAAVGLTYDF